jgi:hypothetical protein
MRFHTALRFLSIGGLLLAGLTSSLTAQMLEPNVHHDAGDTVTGVFEGWFHNPDGSYSMLVGYYNRNLKQELDVPAGPNNRIEPGGPDMGQPTHFQTGRMWGNFVVKVPKNFNPAAKLQWTISANGKTTVVPLTLKPDWELSPFKDADDNTGPMVSFRPFAEKASAVQGPIPVTANYRAVAGEPLNITAYVADDDVVSPASPRPKLPVTVRWTVFRAPANGSVKFSNTRPVVVKSDVPLPAGMKFAGSVSTTATFDQPGNYTLEMTANDVTGDGGGAFQCCWTNSLVNVTVGLPGSAISGAGGK